MNRECAEQHHQCRWAGHDSACDAERAEALEGDRGRQSVVDTPMGVWLRVCVRLVARMFVHVAAPPGVTMDRHRCVAVLMIVIMMMIVSVRMLVMVRMMMVIGGAVFIDALRRRIGAVAADEERRTESSHQQSRRHSEPRVKLLGHDPLRSIKRDDAESVYGNRVRRGYDGAQQHRMTGGAA